MTKLTHEQIDAMEAGPEMDRLMATLVMEWPQNKSIDGWRPSQEVGDAWWAVEKITQPPQTIEEAKLLSNSKFLYWFEHEKIWAMTASEAAEAICRAALKAVTK